MNPVGSQVPCNKCHGDIALELHTGFIHNNFTCSDCHRIQKGVQFASGDDAYERLIYINVTGPSTYAIGFLQQHPELPAGKFPNINGR